MKAIQSKTTFKEALAENEDVSKALSKDELEQALSPENYIGKAQEIVEKLLRKYGD